MSGLVPVAYHDAWQADSSMGGILLGTLRHQFHGTAMSATPLSPQSKEIDAEHASGEERHDNAHDMAVTSR